MDLENNQNLKKYNIILTIIVFQAVDRDELGDFDDVSINAILSPRRFLFRGCFPGFLFCFGLFFFFERSHLCS